MITREMISEGFQNGKASVVYSDGRYGCKGLCCRIGEHEFYFTLPDLYGLTVAEYFEKHKMEETVNMVFSILKNAYSAAMYGINQEIWQYYKSSLTKIADLDECVPLFISMSYIFVGDTQIDIPRYLLANKTPEEQLRIAYEYAQDHIDHIPVSKNTTYIPNSDSFELEDIHF